MGARIEAVATASPVAGLLRRGAVRMSDAAARACLARAHQRADDVELLVNAGVYREKGLAEPALASIIQEDIGANRGHPPRPHRRGTFSFDVLNGGCGFVSAAQIIDGFVGAGTARLGLIVAADADPSPRSSPGFPFAPGGGAVLLGRDADGAGFTRFAVRTFAADAALFEVRLRFDPRARSGIGRRGANVLEVHEDPAFASRCLEHATRATEALLAEEGLRRDDVDLLIGSQYPLGFAPDLARSIGVDVDRVPRVRAPFASTHTAGPIAALEAAVDSGAFARARRTLFVTVGAGITVGLALYLRA